ncbi:MAG: hypothetical protein H7330_09960 [Hymenobacteraceae bacterium]|nr:hypothetical protein [Hymenobacteraceae bacterium]
MHDLNGSEREKKIARGAFDAALQKELSEIVSKFKEMASRAENPDDVWAVEEWLGDQRRRIDTCFDFRHSQLISVFGRLVRDGRVTLQQRQGLDEGKLALIERIATF